MKNVILRYHNRHGQLVAKAASKTRMRGLLERLKECGDYYTVEETKAPLSVDLTVEDFIIWLKKDLNDRYNHAFIFVNEYGDVIAENCRELMSYEPSEDGELSRSYKGFEKVNFLDCEMSVTSAELLVSLTYVILRKIEEDKKTT